ncbi:ICP22 family protein [Cytobacillus stercorigallinarum]|nr:hypothetical protein [Cytobacillus stercorigallinarum]
MRIYIKNEIDTRTNMNVVFDSEIIEMCKTTTMIEGEFIGNGGTNPTDSGEGPKEGKGTNPTDSGEGPKEGKGTNPTDSGEGPKEGKGTNPTDSGGGPKEGKRTNPTDSGERPKEGKGTNSTEPKEVSREGKGPIRSANDVEKYVNLTGAFPFTNKYQKNKRINTLLKEIKNNKYKENRMGSMYLIRSLLETYTHEYIDYFVKNDKIEYRIKGVARDRTKRKQKLRELLYNNIKEHLKKFYPEFEEEIELIEITFTENNNAAATRIINFYIHSQTQVPDYQELLDSWKKVSAILKCLDEILFNNMSLSD